MIGFKPREIVSTTRGRGVILGVDDYGYGYRVYLEDTRQEVWLGYSEVFPGTPEAELAHALDRLGINPSRIPTEKHAAVLEAVRPILGK